MIPLRYVTSFLRGGRSSDIHHPELQDKVQARSHGPVVFEIDPLASGEWEQKISGYAKATIFHSTAWARVLNHTYGHVPRYLTIQFEHGDPVLVPFMEVSSPITGRRGVCLPFSDICGPLALNDRETEKLVPELTGFAKRAGWKTLEIREMYFTPEQAPVSTSFYTHHLELCENVDRLFSSFSGAVRRAIRKAERQQLRIAVRRDAQGLASLFQLHTRTRRRHGLPPQPRSFFDAIQGEILGRNLGFLVLAYHEARPIAAAMFLHFGRKAVYKFGASDERFQQMRPSNLVMWEGIKQLARGGMTTLNLGRTSIDNEGLRHFKQGWGAQEGILGYHCFNPSKNEWVTRPDRAYGRHNHLFARLSLPLNRVLGALLYPHLD